MEGEVKEITPTNGLMLMWPSFLMHGSGATINKSKERIILGFNSYWDKNDKNNAKKQKVRFHKGDRKPKSDKEYDTLSYKIKMKKEVVNFYSKL